MNWIFVYEFWTVLRIQLINRGEGGWHRNCGFFLSYLLLSYFFWFSLYNMLPIHCLLFEWKWKKKQFDDAVANIIVVVTKEKSLKVNDTKILNSTFTIEMVLFFFSACIIFRWRGKKENNACKSRRKGIFLTKQTNDKAREENCKTFWQELLYNFFMVWLKSQVFRTKENSNIVKTILEKSDCRVVTPKNWLMC